MADKGGLQLLPETRKSIQVKVPGENRMVYIGIALVAIVLALYGGLSSYSNSLSTKVSAADDQLLAQEKQRNKKSEQAILTLSQQLGIAAQVINNHIYWSTGFSKIEAAMLNNVQFKSFTASSVDGLLRIRAITDSYSTLARQLASFVADDAIKDVTLDNVNVLTDGKLDFNSQITFDQSKFLKPTQQ